MSNDRRPIETKCKRLCAASVHGSDMSIHTFSYSPSVLEPIPRKYQESTIFNGPWLTAAFLSLGVKNGSE